MGFDKNIRFWLPFAQVLYWLFFYELTLHFYNEFSAYRTRGVQWGISVVSFFYTYLFLVGIAAALITFFDRFKLIVGVVSAVIYLSYIYPAISNYPYKTIFIGFLGLTGFFLEYLIQFFVMLIRHFRERMRLIGKG